MEKYNFAQLGDIPTEREDGAIRILVCKMRGLASKEVREIKIAATERLIKSKTLTCVCVYGGELQLDKSKFVGQLNLVVQRRERSQVGHSTQHDKAQRHVLEIPARKNRDNCQTRMHTIRKKTFNGCHRSG